MGGKSGGHHNAGQSQNGRKHVRQVRDGRGLPQVHVDPQENGTRGARVTVQGSLRALVAPSQWLLLRVSGRARVWLVAGTRGQLGALRSAASVRRYGG